MRKKQIETLYWKWNVYFLSFFSKQKKKKRKENHIDLFCFPLLKSAAESGRKEGGLEKQEKKQEFSLYFAVVPLFFPSPFCSLVVFFFFLGHRKVVW